MEAHFRPASKGSLPGFQGRPQAETHPFSPASQARQAAACALDLQPVNVPARRQGQCGHHLQLEQAVGVGAVDPLPGALAVKTVPGQQGRQGTVDQGKVGGQVLPGCRRDGDGKEKVTAAHH